MGVTNSDAQGLPAVIERLLAGSGRHKESPFQTGVFLESFLSFQPLPFVFMALSFPIIPAIGGKQKLLLPASKDLFFQG